MLGRNGFNGRISTRVRKSKWVGCSTIMARKKSAKGLTVYPILEDGRIIMVVSSYTKALKEVKFEGRDFTMQGFVVE